MRTCIIKRKVKAKKKHCITLIVERQMNVDQFECVLNVAVDRKKKYFDGAIFNCVTCDTVQSQYLHIPHAYQANFDFRARYIYTYFVRFAGLIVNT